MISHAGSDKAHGTRLVLANVKASAQGHRAVESGFGRRANSISIPSSLGTKNSRPRCRPSFKSNTARCHGDAAQRRGEHERLLVRGLLHHAVRRRPRADVPPPRRCANAEVGPDGGVVGDLLDEVQLSATFSDRVEVDSVAADGPRDNLEQPLPALSPPPVLRRPPRGKAMIWDNLTRCCFHRTPRALDHPFGENSS